MSERERRRQQARRDEADQAAQTIRDRLIVDRAGWADHSVEVRWSKEVGFFHGRSQRSGSLWELILYLKRSWPRRVLERGLALVEGCLVLDVLPTSPLNTPTGCDGCWTAKILDVPPSPGVKSIKGVFLVRYGGLLALHHEPMGAMSKLVRQFEAALAPVAPLMGCCTHCGHRTNQHKYAYITNARTWTCANCHREFPT